MPTSTPAEAGNDAAGPLNVVVAPNDCSSSSDICLRFTDSLTRRIPWARIADPARARWFLLSGGLRANLVSSALHLPRPADSLCLLCPCLFQNSDSGGDFGGMPAFCRGPSLHRMPTSLPRHRTAPRAALATGHQGQPLRLSYENGKSPARHVTTSTLLELAKPSPSSHSRLRGQVGEVAVRVSTR